MVSVYTITISDSLVLALQVLASKHMNSVHDIMISDSCLTAFLGRGTLLQKFGMLT